MFSPFCRSHSRSKWVKYSEVNKNSAQLHSIGAVDFAGNNFAHWVAGVVFEVNWVKPYTGAALAAILDVQEQKPKLR